VPASPEDKLTPPAARPRSPSTPGAPVADQPGAPHIDFGASRPRDLQWLKWVFLVLVAVATAIIGFFLLPRGK